MEFLHGLHSGLRYLVLLAGVIAAVVSALGLRRGGSLAAAERGTMAAFVGLLDAQVLVGLLLVLMWPFYGALIGHIVMMVLAAAVAHGGSVLARRRLPAAAAPVRLGALALSLILVIGGIMAIQRSIL